MNERTEGMIERTESRRRDRSKISCCVWLCSRARGPNCHFFYGYTNSRAASRQGESMRCTRSTSKKPDPHDTRPLGRITTKKWQSFGSHLAVIWQSFGSHLAVIWQSFGSHPLGRITTQKRQSLVIREPWNSIQDSKYRTQPDQTKNNNLHGQCVCFSNARHPSKRTNDGCYLARPIH